LPGDVWRDKIEKALKSSYCVIFFASTSSVKSDEVKLEIDYAIKLKKRIIPVLLEKCQLPYEVSNLHHINLIEKTEIDVEVFHQVLSGISSRKSYKPPTNKTAKAVVKDIKTANGFYNTVILPNRFLWSSTVASLFMIALIGYFLIPENHYTDDASKGPNVSKGDKVPNFLDSIGSGRYATDTVMQLTQPPSKHK